MFQIKRIQRLHNAGGDPGGKKTGQDDQHRQDSQSRRYQLNRQRQNRVLGTGYPENRIIAEAHRIIERPLRKRIRDTLRLPHARLFRFQELLTVFVVFHGFLISHTVIKYITRIIYISDAGILLVDIFQIILSLKLHAIGKIFRFFLQLIYNLAAKMAV